MSRSGFDVVAVDRPSLTVRGSAGDDVLRGSAGNDWVYGDTGVDTFVFAAGALPSAVRFDGGRIVADGPDGRDVLVGIERLDFGGQVIDAATASSIGLAYQEYMGRAANAFEFGYWGGEILAGRTNVAGVRQTILADAGGRAHFDATVAGLYQVFGGRAPTAFDYSFWRGALAAGHDFGDVRSAILADGMGHTASVIIDLYQTYGGRDPSGWEIGLWRDQMAAGVSAAQVRGIILNDSLGLSHTAAVVTDLYQQYALRSPEAWEVTIWQGAVAGGMSYADVRQTIVSDDFISSLQPVWIAAEYRDHLGRNPEGGEVSIWLDMVVRGGISRDQMVTTLMRDDGATGAGIQRVAGTAAADVITVDAGRDATVANFDPLRDMLILKGSASANGMEALKAREVVSLGGAVDVLLAMPDRHDVLLTGIHLDALTSANFVFL